jgi:flagellar biosynthetic protein FliR
MNIFNFEIGTFVQFFMVFVRVSAIILTMPIVGSANVPRQVKVGLTISIAYIVLLTTDLPPVDLSISVWQLAIKLVGEVAIGLTIGFASQLIFTAVQLAGSIVGFQMGFAIVNVMDPATQSQVSITAQFQNILALLIFLTIDGHHWLITACAGSYDIIPVLGFHPSAGLVEMMIDLTKNVFVAAIKLASPIIASLFILNVALGLIARTVPQMNVFIVGFPLQISIGLFLLGASTPIFLLLFRQWFTQLFNDLHGLMRLMS